MNDTPAGQVVLADQTSVAQLFYDVIQHTVRNYPSDFSALNIPASADEFRKSYPQWLPHFESLRLASSARLSIARDMLNQFKGYIHWQDGKCERPLAAQMAGEGVPLSLMQHQFPGSDVWQPTMTYLGQRWDGTSMASLAERLGRRNVISGKASEQLIWLAQNELASGLDLRGRKIVMLGANAEMAPTRHWLAAGADVLWLDTQPPPEDWLHSRDWSGSISWPEQPVDLLRQPADILATIRQFAGQAPVDLGLYAYAPGQAREVKLTEVMNALVDALPGELLRSVTLLVSPTTPTALEPDDVIALEQRLAQRPAWEAVLGGMGLLGRRPEPVAATAAPVTHTVVGIQGASYQAAQYFGKVLAAELWRATGSHVVSANTAAITKARSLDHPVFAAAFGGAAAFGVETMTPRQSRCLNGLLAAADWLRPEAAAAGAVRVHGGLHTLPYPLEAALQIAAGFGFVRSPRLVKGLFKR